jgi:hypothetical protein
LRLLICITIEKIMKEKNILKNITETLTDKPKYELTIPVVWSAELPKRTLWDRMRGKPAPSPERKRTFVLRPCKVGNMYRIAGRAAQLPHEIKQGSMSEVILPVIAEHLDDLVYIVASGIQNDHNEPSKELMLFIERNFDAEDLYSCLYPVLENVGMQSFLNSIALAKGTLTILKPSASPNDGSE